MTQTDVNLIEHQVSLASMQYQGFITKVQAAFLNALHDGSDSVHELERKLNDIVEADTGIVSEAINAADETVGNKALSRTTSPEEFRSYMQSEDYDSLVDYLQDMSDQLHLNIRQQLKRDVHQLVQVYRKYKVHLVYASGDTSLQVQARERAMDFYKTIYRDRGGKRWDSKVYVVTEIRQYLYQLYNTITLWNLVKQGEDRATVIRPGHITDGREFGISEYFRYLPQWFHPNARAIVGRA